MFLRSNYAWRYSTSRLMLGIFAGLSILGPDAAFAAGCVGECVGNGNARDGRECFDQAQVQTLEQILPVLRSNGTFCPEDGNILGVQVTDASSSGGCKRIDLYYCQTAVSGFAMNRRIEREPRECFSTIEASNFIYLQQTISRNGTTCPRDAFLMQGIKLKKVDGCWRAPAVYCRGL
jgi:hypothetical protein